MAIKYKKPPHVTVPKLKSVKLPKLKVGKVKKAKAVKQKDYTRGIRDRFGKKI